MKRKLMLGGLLLSLCLLIGCTSQTADPETTTLRVLTERSLSDGMNYQAEQIAAAFVASHDGVTVEIEFPPEDEDERTLYLYQMRTEIMAGGGPDVYLLPTKGVLNKEFSTAYGDGVETYEVEPLFADINLSIRNGVFQDIGTYYDQDSDLRTEALNQTVMDAGVFEGKRYVLPLRYNMPVLLTNPGNPRLMRSDDLTLLDVADQAIAADDPVLSIPLEMPSDFSALSPALDYDTGRVLVSQEEIARYLWLYQQICAIRTGPLVDFFETEFQRIHARTPEEYMDSSLIEYEIFPIGLSRYCEAHYFCSVHAYWSTASLPFFAGDLCDALDNAGIAQYLGLDAAAQPLRTADGAATAEVTYFGAVGAGCENPALAYQFLREFLSEDAQWELLRPRTDFSHADIWNIPPQVQNWGLVEYSMPVRIQGAVPYLWDTIQYQVYGGGVRKWGYTFGEDPKGTAAVAFHNQITLTDEDLPILFTPIDEVRFPVTLPKDESMAWALAQLNEEDGTPTDVDIDALAEQLYRNLWWHLAEG